MARSNRNWCETANCSIPTAAAISLTVHGASRSRATICSHSDETDHGQECDPRPNQEHVYFSTADLAEARARAVTARPSTGPTEIRDMPSGERSFYLTDPWRNPLCIIEDGSEFTTGWVH